MAALMAVLGIPAFAVAGWSEGADVALFLATSYPDRVTHLVIWGGIAAVRREDIEVFEATRDAGRWPSRLRESMTALYGESYWKRVWERWCDVMQALYFRGGEVMCGRPQEVRCPTLILHGEQDLLISTFHPQILHRHIHRSLLYLFPDGRHNVHLTHAAEFNRVVMEFLTSSPDSLP